ncbi:MAG: hypothetical protein O3C60_11685 [Planctomycetota bacterium]|nr:hypothetical protein [Planctomycetota bacterium]
MKWPWPWLSTGPPDDPSHLSPQISVIGSCLTTEERVWQGRVSRDMRRIWSENFPQYLPIAT